MCTFQVIGRLSDDDGYIDKTREFILEDPVQIITLQDMVDGILARLDAEKQISRIEVYGHGNIGGINLCGLREGEEPANVAPPDTHILSGMFGPAFITGLKPIVQPLIDRMKDDCVIVFSACHVAEEQMGHNFLTKMADLFERRVVGCTGAPYLDLDRDNVASVVCAVGFTVGAFLEVFNANPIPDDTMKDAYQYIADEGDYEGDEWTIIYPGEWWEASPGGTPTKMTTDP